MGDSVVNLAAEGWTSSLFLKFSHRKEATTKDPGDFHGEEEPYHGGPGPAHVTPQ